MIQLIEAGHTYKVHGIKGDLVVDFKKTLQKHILKTGVVFIKQEGNAVPFFIESVKGNDEFLIKFKEVDSPEFARKLSNQIVYIDSRNLNAEHLNDEEPDENNALLSFVIEDVVSGFKGRIKDIEEFPGQLMALVEIGEKEVMIPIHEDWIVKIDEKKKQIQVELPDGLLDL